MKPFFNRPDTKWRNLRGALHFYVLPKEDSNVLDVYEHTVQALSGFPGLAVQPAQYVHMTLQRLDAYANEFTAAQWDAWHESLTSLFAQVEPFTVDISAAEPKGHAVEAIGTTVPSWHKIIAGIRESLIDHQLGHFLTEPPFGPHYTVAYCTTTTDDEAVKEALAPVSSDTQFAVEKVSLVAVEQRPDDGIFTFDRLHAWQLGGSSIAAGQTNMHGLGEQWSASTV